MECRRRVLIARQAVEEHQGLTLGEEARIIGWKALADMSEDALAQRDGFVELAERPENAGKVVGGCDGSRRIGSGEFLQGGKHRAEVGLRRRFFAGVFKESSPGDNGAGRFDQALRRFRRCLAQSFHDQLGRIVIPGLIQQPDSFRNSAHGTGLRWTKRGHSTKLPHCRQSCAIGYWPLLSTSIVCFLSGITHGWTRSSRRLPHSASVYKSKCATQHEASRDLRRFQCLGIGNSNFGFSQLYPVSSPRIPPYLPRPRPTALSFALGQENGNTPVTGFQVSKKKLSLRLTSPRPWLAHALRDRGYAPLELRGHLALPR